MGRRSGYDHSGIRQGAPGARRPVQPHAPPSSNLPAAPATQGGLATTQTRTPTTSITGITTQATSYPTARPFPYASGATQSAGTTPAHVPSERRTPQEYDTAREYAAVETGRLPQQPRVPEGGSRLAHEIRRMDGPSGLPSVRPARWGPSPDIGGRGAAIANPRPFSSQRSAPMAATSSDAALTAGVGNQLSRAVLMERAQREAMWAEQRGRGVARGPRNLRSSQTQGQGAPASTRPDGSSNERFGYDRPIGPILPPNFRRPSQRPNPASTPSAREEPGKTTDAGAGHSSG